MDRGAILYTYSNMKLAYNVELSQVKPREIAKVAKKLEPVIKHLRAVANYTEYDQPQSFINLPFDEENFARCLALKHQFAPRNPKYVILIGIGGSAVGVKAIYDALLGHYDLVEPRRTPKLIVLDTIDDVYLKKTLNFVARNISSPEEVLFVVISASGNTKETCHNQEYVLQKFPQAAQRMVAITEKHSFLWNRAAELGIVSLEIPKKVSGRYGVFSTKGIFPLACLGIDILALAEGAMLARTQALSEISEANSVLTSAAINYIHYQVKKRPIHTMFLFDPRLESLGKWYRQMLAESLGKEENLKNQKVNVGITPSIAVATKDFHTMLQLYLGGPNDKFTTFVYAQSDEVFDKARKGVKTSYIKKNRPFIEFYLSDDASPAPFSVKSLGYFMQFKMIETMFWGVLLNINPFDQPEVEDYKKYL